VGCYIWYSEEGTGRGCSSPSPLLAVPNVTTHRSTASVPITVLLYDDPLLCGFNVAIKGLINKHYENTDVDLNRSHEISTLTALLACDSTVSDLTEFATGSVCSDGL